MSRSDHRISRVSELRAEIKRISNVTLQGNFATPADRDYWEKRLKKLSNELSALEDQMRPSRKVFQK